MRLDKANLQEELETKTTKLLFAENQLKQAKTAKNADKKDRLISDLQSQIEKLRHSL